MRHPKLVACLWLVIVCIQTPHTSAASLNVLGLEDMSCATWKKNISSELREPYVQWVRGFLTGHNYANQSHQVGEVSRSTVEMFVDRFCAEHATANVTDAAMRMSDRYSGRNSPITH